MLAKRILTLILAGAMLVPGLASAQTAGEPSYYFRFKSPVRFSPPPSQETPLSSSTPGSFSGVPTDNWQLGASGGKTPYKWSLSGSYPGLTLTQSGKLTTTVAGSWPVVSTLVTDSSTPPKTLAVSFNLSAALPFTSTTEESLTGEANEPHQLTAEGGIEPYTWESETLPDEVELTPEGILTAKEPGTWEDLEVILKDSSTPALTLPVTFDLEATAVPSSLVGWGQNTAKQLALEPDATQANVPTAVAATFFADKSVSKVSGGNQYACALVGGDIFCWGSNALGKAGQATTITELATPTKVAGSGWKTLDTGLTHTCALRTNGDLYCWGSNASKQINGTGTASYGSPILVGGGYEQVSVGQDKTCGIRNGGELYCWGKNPANSSTSGTPLREAWNFPDWSYVDAETNICGIRAGNAYCWGDNASGQLGRGGGSQINPQTVGSGLMDGGWSTITMYQTTVCGIRNGAVYCWGSDTAGRVGNSTPAAPFAGSTPTPTGGGSTGWSSIGMGSAHMCGMRGSQAYCWGQTCNGKLGNGQTQCANANTPSPVSVVAPAGKVWSSISVGADSTYGLVQ